MAAYINLHNHLNQQRDTAKAALQAEQAAGSSAAGAAAAAATAGQGASGPRVIIVGATDCGGWVARRFTQLTSVHASEGHTVEEGDGPCSLQPEGLRLRLLLRLQLLPNKLCCVRLHALGTV